MLHKIIDPSEETKALFGRNTGYPKWERERGYDPDSVIPMEGVIEKVYWKPKMPSCDVQLVQGGILKFLPFPGGTLDEITQQLHGDFILPVKGQRVVISFTHGDTTKPYISELIWRAGDGLFAAQYIAYPLLAPLTNKEDMVARGHKSGAIQKMTSGRIFSGFFDLAPHSIVTPQGGGDILQEATIPNDPLGTVKVGPGGTTGHSDVALVGVNYVITATGLQPILPVLIGPGAAQYPLGVSLKA